MRTPEKLQLSNEETANLSDTYSKHCCQDAPQLTGYFKSIKKTQAAMKVALCEIKKNLQGPNSDGKETRTQINGSEQKEERNIQPEKNEEMRIQKNEERLRNLQDIFKHSNIQIIGVPEGEKEDQEIENIFEKIMENFPNICLLYTSDAADDAGQV